MWNFRPFVMKTSDITWKFSGISSGIMCYNLEI